MTTWKQLWPTRLALLAGMLALYAPAGLAQKPPQEPSLPNFDQRHSAATARTKAANPAREAALGQLRNRVPDLQVEFDEITDTPHWISSARGFLTGPGGEGRAVSAPRARSFGPADPHGAVKAFVEEHRTLFRHGAEALEAAQVARDYVTAHNGLRTVAWQQRVDGIPVLDGLLISHVTKRGELVSLSSRFLPDLDRAANARTPKGMAQRAIPTISATEAIACAAANLGEAVTVEQVTALEAIPQKADQRRRFKAGRLPGNAEASLVWMPISQSALHLCWRVEATRSRAGERYAVFIDAETGEAVARRCLTFYLSDVSYRVFTSDSPSPFSPSHSEPSTNQPPLVPRQMVTWPALSTNASPAGWIADGENETRGNNVDAHLDRDADDQPDLPRPQGSPFRVFDPPLDLTRQPTTYGDATVVSLFYWCNWMHDQLYELGFTEASGNFQKDNFGRGGEGDDILMANAQDGSGVNNANFTFTYDGTPPRIQMYVFDGPQPNRDGDFDAEVILHEYTHGLSTRLVGGGVGIWNLQTWGLSEGWSDFYALALLSEPEDDVDANYIEGGYVTFGYRGLMENYYFGIRRYPYSTDLLKSPLTFKDIDPSQISSHPGVPRSPNYRFDPALAAEVHNQGEVWCAMLWEARANLIRKYGFAMGNRLILQLVTDSLKLSPPNPNWTEARNAILQADLVNDEGRNQNELWAAFAKRGLGFGASISPSWTLEGVIESYEVPNPITVTPLATVRFSGPVGGEVSPACHVYTVTNPSTNEIVWQAGISESWLEVSPFEGRLGPGATIHLSVCATPDTVELAPGLWSAVLEFRDLGAGTVQTRIAQLTVVQTARLPFAEGFESGELAPYWTVSGSSGLGAGVSAGEQPHQGDFHLTLSSAADGFYARNEATLTLDLAGYTNVVLRFWAKEFSDEPHGPPPEPFIDRANFDGVAVSADGVQWFEVQPLRTLSDVYADYTVALDPVMARHGLNYNGAFRVRFNQYGNRSVPNDGIAIDDIEITGVAPKRFSISLPTTAREGDGLLVGQGRVSLPFPVSNDLLVSLVSSNLGPLRVPESVTIRAGQASATFDLIVVDDALLDGTEIAAVAVLAPGYIGADASMPVLDNETAALTLTLPPVVREGDEPLLHEGLVMASRAPSRPTVITLTSSNTGEIRVPSSVILGSNETSVSFPIEVVDDSRLDGSQTSLITARVDGWTVGSAPITVLDNEGAALGVQLPALAREGQAAGGLVFVSGSLPTNLTVALSVTQTNAGSVPPLAIIPAGQFSAPFTLALANNTTNSGERLVTVRASASGFFPGGSAMRVLDDDGPLVPFAPVPSDRSNEVPTSVTLSWAVGVSDLVSNGDFEAGALTGWYQEGSPGGGFVINDGQFDPTGPEGPQIPFAGNFSVVSHQSAPGTRVLYQDFDIPPTATKATLSWTHRVRNHAPYFAADQGFRVEVRDLLDVVTATAFTTQAGDPLLGDWSEHLASLSAYRGSRVRVAFVVSDSVGFLNVHLDNVRVMLEFPGATVADVFFGTNSVPGQAEWMGVSTNAAWTLPALAPNTTYFWRVVSRSGGEEIAGPTWRFKTQAVGPVDHFTWDPVPSPQTAYAPFRVTLTAQDEAGRTATNFVGPVALTTASARQGEAVHILSFVAWADQGQEYRNMLGAIATWFTNFMETRTDSTDPAGIESLLVAKDVFLVPEQEFAMSGDLEPLGKAWGPVLSNFVSAGGTVIVCSYRGSEHRILSDSGLLSLDRLRGYGSLELGQGASHPLLEGVRTPFTGQNIVTYNAVNGDVLLHGASNGEAAIIARNIGAGQVLMIGSDFSASRTGLDRLLANAIRAKRGEAGSPLTVSPGVGGYFLDGVWNGDVAVLGVASQLALEATDAEGHTGVSTPFDVGAANDLSVTIADSLDPVMVGNPVVYSVTVSNSGPQTAETAILVCNPINDLVFLAVTNVEGACTIGTNGVACEFGSLAGRATRRVDITAIPQRAGRLTNAVSVSSKLTEAWLANNSASVVSRVTAPTLSVSAATVNEPDSGAVDATLTLTLSPASSQWVSVDYTTSNLTAMAMEDYVPTSGTVVFPPGITNQTLTVQVKGDTLDEGYETFHVKLLRATNAVILTSYGAVIIVDNDPSPVISIQNATVVEGGRGETTNLVFDLNLSFISGQVVTVGYTTAAATARAGRDYVGASGTVAFEPGMIHQAVTVTVLGDESSESNETFLVNLTNPSGALLATNSAVGTILDDDTGRLDHFTWSPVVPVQLVEVPFPATLTAHDGFGNVVSNFTGPANLTALAASQDFVIGSGEEAWEYPMGAHYHDQRLQAIYLTDEIGLPVRISALSLQVNQPPAQRLGAWTIRMKHTALPSFTKAQWDETGWTTVYQKDETMLDSGWVTFDFTVPFEFNGSDNLLVDFSFNNASYTTNGYCLFTATDEPRSLGFRTDSGFGDPLAWAGVNPPPTLFRRVPNIRLTTETVAALAPQTVSNFVNGVWTGNLVVSELATDLRLRANDGNGHSGLSEPFAVTATNDLSLRVAVSPSPASLGEPLTYTLLVSNTGPSQATTVRVVDQLPPGIEFVSASASQGTCGHTAGTVTCQVGQLPASETASLVIVAMTANSGFFTNRASLTRGEADGFLGNNVTTLITPVFQPKIYLDDTAGIEGDSETTNLIFTVRLSGPTSQPVTVHYFPVDGSASNNFDFISLGGSVTFAPGTRTQQIVIPLIGDTSDETNETFRVVLTEPVNATLGDDEAVGTILDDDAPPRLTVTDISVAEGDSGFTSASFIVNLSAPSGLLVRLSATTTNGTATAASDYTAVTRQLLVPPGLAFVRVNVPVTPDRQVEPDETFFLRLSSPSNATIEKGLGTCTILNDDGVPGRIDHIEWQPLGPLQFVDQPFSATLRALDSSNNPAFTFTGSVSLSGHTDSPDTTIGQASSTFLSPFPLATGYHDARTQVIYRTNEIGGARRFLGLALDTTLAAGQMMHRFTIRMKHTPLASFTTAVWDVSGWTTVYQADQSLTATGWVTFPFIAPFDYNGTSNLMVDLSFDNTYFTSDGACRITVTNANRMLTAQTDSQFGDPRQWTGSTPAPTARSSFPNIKLVAGSDIVLVPNLSGSFVNGIWQGEVIIRQAATNLILRADSSGRLAFSTAFNVMDPAADTDNDGLADGWELRYFGSLNAPGGGPTDDPDQDGSNNRHEYQSGTDPLDPTSVLIMTTVRLQGADAWVEFRTVAGRSYRVERSSNLVPTSWTTVASNVAGTGDTVAVIDPDAAAQGSRFYRVRLLP